ncbi:MULTISPECIES: EhaF family protein [Methanobrevibacter]|jgi:energy-converting hydrogenase A subunit F|uniref:EhaF family protein n=1 Tax=Methanobrevibacter TaxID=2172 RepID=UPI0003348E37|nr:MULTISPECIES: EhaF family protein [Methanobrevibacter]AGN16836.1 energy-converting hydrogenase A subunit F EhaF [Methanobrevibacter sp. AbM4]MCI6774921.1 EhaF family protein [Methanobrevibacter boviskoreani]MCI6931446.1 EhaF family protein [Methanobrevibacter boviskoreani]MDD6257338.1 EhaF family protein [Methanobrevibacter boviskoreani]MDY5613784.1 EhaF family protein [Methanobrevibacter boviskoreani]
MRIGDLWNKLATPKRIPRLFALILGIALIIGLLIPVGLNVDQIYPRPEPQVQVDQGMAMAPYARGGEPLKERGITISQYPQYEPNLGWINSYVSPLSQFVMSISPYFGTSIYSSPGGLIDEILYYTRGFDTVLESSILMMAFIIASWLCVNYTMNRKNDPENIKKDMKVAISESDRLASEVEMNNRKAHIKQNRRDN